MAQVNVLNTAGDVVGQIELDDSVFGIEPNAAVVHQAVVCQLANARRGTADTQTRAEVTATGSKPWRQKGTGRARHGSRRGPQWRGGGVGFGPHPRSYEQKLPKKMRRLALRSVLSSKVAEDRIMVLERLEMEAPRTKEMAALLSRLGVDGKAMIVLGKMDEAVRRSARNLPEVLAVTPGSMNLLDLLYRDRVVMTVDAIAAITKWLGGAAAEVAEAAAEPELAAQPEAETAAEPEAETAAEPEGESESTAEPEAEPGAAKEA
jgi:large subunit ribosomal protein L4